MASLAVEDATTKYHLSQRGAYNAVHRDIWGVRAKQFATSWAVDNPDGAINLRLAENDLQHDEIGDFIHKNLQVRKIQHLTYSTGPQGSTRLRNAAAKFLETEFAALTPISEDDIYVTAGLAGAIDTLTWAICNEGDGIIIPTPMYNGFQVDIQHRSGAVIVQANFSGLKGHTGLDDVFDPVLNRRALERAHEQAKSQGIVVRGVLIANPHNPLGRCYPVETLKEIAKFCDERQCHFISDEIYARSVFHNPKIADAPDFTSTLAVDLSGYIDPLMHHVLYGASKDFCVNGLRLGLVYTRNRGIIAAMSSIGPLSWSPHLLQDIWAAMLEDDKWRQQFFARNKQLMQQQYQLASELLNEAGIPFYQSLTTSSNAGVFIWIDLRSFFFFSAPTTTKSAESEAFGNPSANKQPVVNDINDNHVNGNDIKHRHRTEEHNTQRELQIIESCTRNRVLIAPGSVYKAEEHGWFRITFTTAETPLRLGIERMISALRQVRESDRKGIEIAV